MAHANNECVGLRTQTRSKAKHTADKLDLIMLFTQLAYIYLPIGQQIIEIDLLQCMTHSKQTPPNSFYRFVHTMNFRAQSFNISIAIKKITTLNMQ